MKTQRQLDHAVVRAPFDGMVGEVDSLQPGTLVISAMSAFTTTSAVGLIGNDIWIEADMKETDLTHVHHGAAGGHHGRHLSRPHMDTAMSIASAPAATRSFSALPAENASGNWVKVVQRIPVRIAIDQKAGRSAAARRHERRDLHRHRQAPLAAHAERIGRFGNDTPRRISRTPPMPMTARSLNGRC